MPGRPSLKKHLALSGTRDINLIPLMNVFCILIPFLIMVAIFVQVSIVDVVLPAAAEQTTTESKEKAPPEEQKAPPKLNLTVAITKQGFIIAGYGGVLDVVGVCGSVSEPQQEGAMPRYIIPKRADGQWDFDCLQKNLIRIKEAYPDQFSIIILPEGDISYQTIIDVMDVAREYKTTENGKKVAKIMFPSPVLAGGVFK